MPELSKPYSSRSAAKRAARAACRKALDAPLYEAAEGPDFLLHPQSDPDGPLGLDWQMSTAPHRYELRGPAAEAVKGETALEP